MHEKTRKIFFRIRAGNAEETQIWFSYSAQHLPITTSHFLALNQRERRSLLSVDISVTAELEWASLCPDLAEVDSSSVLQHCTGVLCTVPPPLLSASWPLTETLTHSPLASTGPGLTLTLTLRQQHGAIIWERPANFQIKSQCWWSKYLHSQACSHCIQQQRALPACQLSLKSWV